MIEIKIVVETSISRRTYIQLGLGEKTQHSRRQNVRCRVAQFLNRSHLLHCYERFFRVDQLMQAGQHRQRQSKYLLAIPLSGKVGSKPLFRFRYSPTFTGGIVFHLILVYAT